MWAADLCDPQLLQVLRWFTVINIIVGEPKKKDLSYAYKWPEMMVIDTGNWGYLCGRPIGNDMAFIVCHWHSWNLDYHNGDKCLTSETQARLPWLPIMITYQVQVANPSWFWFTKVHDDNPWMFENLCQFWILLKKTYTEEEFLELVFFKNLFQCWVGWV